MIEPLVIVLIIVVVAAVAYLGYLQQQKRRQALAAFAAARGWAFESAADYDAPRRYPQVDAFQRGHSRYAYNTVRASVEIFGLQSDVVLGDYHYRETTGSGKNRRTTTHQFSYLIYHLPFDCGCELRVRREGFFDKMASFVGFDDIDFESAEFSRQFYVKCSDKKFAYDVVHPRMMEFLLDGESPPLMVSGGICVLSDDRRCWSPEQFAATLAWGEQFFAAWPRYLIDQLDDRSSNMSGRPLRPR